MSNKTNWGYIVKENLLNEVTIPREFDATELAVSKMRVETGTDNPILMAKDAAETYIDNKLAASIADAHKSIAGEFEVTNLGDVQTFFADYAAGKDIVLTNGRVFNNGNASPGEVIFLVPSATSSLKAEEIIVGSTKNLITLSDENNIDSKFIVIEDELSTLTSTVNSKESTADVDTKIAAEAKARDDKDVLIYGEVVANTGKIASNVSALGVVNGRIDTVNAKDLDQDGRLEALETAESLDDKVWTGSVTGATSISLSSLQDQNGNVFDFTAGKKLEIVMEHTSDEVEQGQDIVVGSANATPYSIGTVGFTAKISTAGLLTLVKPAGAGNISDFALVRIVEALAAPAVNTGYTKNEANTRFATPAQVNAVDTKVTTLTTTVGTKQDTTDASLVTTTKSVVGAINELAGRADNNETDTKELNAGNFDIKGDGTVVVKMFNDDGTLTDAFESLIKTRTDAEINALIDAKLSTVMSVTFDDNSAGTYKIGK